ncbi:MAG: hypothetical protein N4A33_00580 [Bacteriovoracaceae bacterium]|nr:hypothetical protein [Bacteriovoracaceae bacterium]
MLTLFLSLIFLTQVMAQSQQECANMQGHYWHSELGCQIDPSAQATREAAQGCVGLTGSELAACTEKIAKDQSATTASQHIQSMSEDKSFKGYKIPGAMFIGSCYAAFDIIKKGSVSDCSIIAAWMMLGAGVVAFSGHLAAILTQTKRQKDATYCYKKEVEGHPIKDDKKCKHYYKWSYPKGSKYHKIKGYLSGNDINSANNDLERASMAQSRAFDLLVYLEKVRERTARTRLVTLSIASTLFAAAAVVAAFEIYYKGSSTCNTTTTSFSHDKLPNYIDIESVALFTPLLKDYSYLNKITENEYIEIIKKIIYKNILIDNAYSIGGPGSPVEMAALLAKLEKIKKAAEQPTKTALKTPVTVMAYNALMAATGVTMIKQANSIMKTAIKRQSEISEMRKGFEGAGISADSCSEADYNNSKKPSCFCYNPDGTKDMRKRQLQICYDQWGTSFDPNGTNYNTNETIGFDTTKTCITKSHEADIGCRCKKNNTCLTLKSLKNFKGFSTDFANSAIADANALFSNGLESGNLSSASYMQKASSMNKKLSKLMNDKKHAKLMKKVKGYAGKISLGMRNIYEKNKFDQYEDSFFGEDNQQYEDFPKEVQKQAKKVDKKRKSHGFVQKKTQEPDFDFGLDNGEAAGIEIEDEVAKNENVDYDYKGDINDNPDHNIFKILTNRYQSSGLKKLFSDDKK